MRQLSLLDSTMLIIGSMIGSGIFIVSADIAQAVQTPGLLLLSWVVAGLITVLGALSYGELAAMMPKAGGQYVYLRETYGQLMGFLFGWTLFAVIQTGTIAAVAVGFAKFSGVFFLAVNDAKTIGGVFSTQQAVAIGLIWFISLYNFRNVKTGAFVQNVFTFAKVGALLAVVVLGLIVGFSGAESYGHFVPLLPAQISLSTVGVFGAALTGSLFAADAWNNITYTAGEISNPQRNIPRALLLGTASVILLYLLANVAYLAVLPISDIAHAENGRVGTLLMERVMGNKGRLLMAALIMVSTFGCLNGVILSAARVYYAMAADKLFFPQAAKLNSNGSPATALVLQAAWSSVLALSGTYGTLLGYIMFAVLLFYILTITAIFVLRRRLPNVYRPYKAWGYPFVPALYILLAGLVCVDMLIYNTLAAGAGLAIIALGIPVYYIFRAANKARA